MSKSRIHKTIWMYWHQGFDQAPSLIGECVKHWKALHPEWEIHLLDRHTVSQYADPLPISPKKEDKMSLAHRSDLIRTQLLIKHGGVWADPTCFPIKPLDDWLPGCMSSGLFFFYKPGRDRIISNWFIAAEKENQVLSLLYNELCAYWEQNDFRNLGRKPTKNERLLYRIINRNLRFPKIWLTSMMTGVFRIYPYMIYHYMFYHIVTSDKSAADAWKKMPKLSAVSPHIIQRIGMLSEMSEEKRKIIEDSKAPLYKLTYKFDASRFNTNSVLHYLLGKY